MEKSVAIIGGGPAGLMAAEVISARGVKVEVYDSMQPVVWPPPMAEGSGGVPVVVAPSGPLDFHGGTVTRHRLTFSFRMR